MGTGIRAAIPLIITLQDRYKIDERYFAKGFFSNYNAEETDGRKEYVIKENVLLDNYQSFLIEFYDCIGEDFYESTALAQGEIPVADNIDDFKEAFSSKNRNSRVPCIYETPYMFSTLGCQCDDYWVFYDGSYKAYLEVYITLLHFEKVLAKAMNNPLANAIKFGIFG
jgi:hypothetical protein